MSTISSTLSTSTSQPNTLIEKTNIKKLILLSPILIITIVHLVARISHSINPEWSWLFTAITYWGLTGLMKFLFTTNSALKSWFKKPEGNRMWLFLGVLIGLGTAAGILLPNLNLLTSHVGLTVFWFLFALINPWFEEGYWRGLLLDAGENWSRWAIICYSTFFFVLSHPLMWGVFSIANRSFQMYAALIVMGILWSWIRYKTGSLRWAVYSHMLVDLGNLSIFVFLNLYIPPQML